MSWIKDIWRAPIIEEDGEITGQSLPLYLWGPDRPGWPPLFSTYQQNYPDDMTWHVKQRVPVMLDLFDYPEIDRPIQPSREDLELACEQLILCPDDWEIYPERHEIAQQMRKLFDDLVDRLSTPT